jgi:hypothetical protein
MDLSKPARATGRVLGLSAAVPVVLITWTMLAVGATTGTLVGIGLVVWTAFTDGYHFSLDIMKDNLDI